MSWLGRRTVALCAVLILLIGSVVWVNRASAGPNPLHAYGLDLCHGRPCFLGITPGTTPWQDARAIPHGYETPDGTHLVLSMGDTQFRLMTYADEAASPVQAVYGRNLSDGDFPHLGQFLLQYGLPCGVAIGDQRDQLELRYPTLDLNVTIGDRNDAIGLTVDSPVAYLTVLGATPGMCAAEHICSAVLPWLGFRSLDYYRAHGLPTNRRSCYLPGQ